MLKNANLTSDFMGICGNLGFDFRNTTRFDDQI